MVVAETLIHGVTSLRIPEQLWVQALDAEVREKCDRPGNHPIIDRQGGLSDGSCGAADRCFNVVRVYRKAKLNQNRSPR